MSAKRFFTLGAVAALLAYGGLRRMHSRNHAWNSIENFSSAPSTALLTQSLDRARQLPRAGGPPLTEEKPIDAETRFLLGFRRGHATEDLDDSGVDREKVAETARKIERQLVTCLKTADLCGQKPDPRSPYFNASQTPLHIVLNRALEALGALGEIPPSELLSALAVTNPETQALATDLLVKSSLSPENFDAMLNFAPKLTDQAAPHFFAALQASAAVSPEREIKLVESMRAYLATDDEGAFYLIENMDQVHLNESEFRSAASSLCRLRLSPRTQQNWILTRHKLDQYISSQGWSFKADDICS